MHGPGLPQHADALINQLHHDVFGVLERLRTRCPLGDPEVHETRGWVGVRVGVKEEVVVRREDVGKCMSWRWVDISMELRQ